MNQTAGSILQSNFKSSHSIQLSFEFFETPTISFIFLVMSCSRIFYLLARDVDEEVISGYSQGSFKERMPSFYIKKRMQALIITLYLASFILCYILPPNIFWQNLYQSISFLYFIPILSWVAAFILLDIESTRKIPQSIYYHRWFWIGYFVLNSKIFLSNYYYTFASFIIDVCRELSCMILFFYAVFKPDDFRVYALNVSMPTTEFIYKRKKNKTNTTVILELSDMIRSPEMSETKSQQNPRIKKVKKDEPKENFSIIVSKVLLEVYNERLQTNEKVFKIRTVIGKEDFETYRSIREFNDLKQYYIDICNEVEFPEKYQFFQSLPDNIDTNVALVDFYFIYRDIEKFLLYIIEDSRLVTTRFLNFLNVYTNLPAYISKNLDLLDKKSCVDDQNAKKLTGEHRIIFKILSLFFTKTDNKVSEDMGLELCVQEFHGEKLSREYNIVRTMNDLIEMSRMLVQLYDEEIGTFPSSDLSSYEKLTTKITNYINTISKMEKIYEKKPFVNFISFRYLSNSAVSRSYHDLLKIAPKMTDIKKTSQKMVLDSKNYDQFSHIIVKQLEQL